MTDPLAEIVTLLQPSAPFSKVVVGAGSWCVRRSDAGRPFYWVVLEGACRVTASGHPPMVLQAGDFMLLPAVQDFMTTSLEPPAADEPDVVPVRLPQGEMRIGRQDGPTDVLMLVGHCEFASPDAALLVSLLPRLIRVHGEARLATLVQLLGDETRAARPAREVIMARLLEVLLIEALRAVTQTSLPPGLLRGLADDRLAAAIRRMHESPAGRWTVAQLAREAGLSRSAFFDRFRHGVGVAPMEYLLAWRMALAKNLLRSSEGTIAEIAERVGYGSASALSVAFTRHVGRPPTHYARQHASISDPGTSQLAA